MDDLISEHATSEREAFDLFFQLREEYDLAKSTWKSECTLCILIGLITALVSHHDACEKVEVAWS